MTLDDIIAKLTEAKEHCVPGNSQVHIWKSSNSLIEKDKLEGKVWYVDYDNVAVNLYYDSL